MTSSRKISSTAKISEDAQIVGSGSLVIEDYSVIEGNVLIDLGENGAVTIGPKSKLKWGCVLRTYDGSIEIGHRSSVGEYTVLAGHGGLNIGDSVIIAGHCYISAAGHIFSSADPIRFQGETAKGIEIKSGAWLGAQSVVLDGISIGSDSVIGAGSVVTNTIRDNVVAIGSPCKERYSREIGNLEEI